MKDVMKKLEAMKSVYCYYFPEVHSLLREVSDAIPREMYMVTTPVEYVYKKLEHLFDPPLDIPATERGHIKLDEIHVPIIERIVNTYSSLVPRLEDFKHSYPTSGSSEGIFKLLTKLKVEEGDRVGDMAEGISVLLGDYEGYKEYAGPEDLMMKVNIVDPEETDSRRIEPSYWFMSNPSARNGNIIPNEHIMELCDVGHKIFLDLSYVGSTEPYEFDVSHKNIEAVLMSFSKPYGVFRKRIGFVLAKEPIHSLYGNKWFKDDERLLQALKLAEDIGPEKLYKKYKPVQEKIIGYINNEYGLNIRPSDVFLLGYMTEEDASKLDEVRLKLIEPFKREKNYRFCLTPYFEEAENDLKL